MPAFITHYLYGVDLYHHCLPKNIRASVKKNPGPYCLGLQGPDFFFYDPISMLLPNQTNLGSLMHEVNISSFFENYIYQLDNLSDDKKSIAIAYLCGFLAHYTLDSSLHPYVYDRTGFDPNSKPSSRHSMELHGEIEASIDQIYLKERMHKKPSEFHNGHHIRLTPNEFQTITKIMSHTLKATFCDSFLFEATRFGISFSLFSFQIALRVFHTNTGAIKFFIEKFERMILGDAIVSPTIKWNGHKDLYDSLNRTHTKWKNPWNPAICSSKSVDELYDDAKLRYQNIMPLLDAYLRASKEEKSTEKEPLIQEIGNFSYHSGMDVCNRT